MFEWVRAIYHAYMHGIPSGPLAFGVRWPLPEVLLGSAIGLVVGAVLGLAVGKCWLWIIRLRSSKQPALFGTWSGRRLVGRVVVASALLTSLLGGIVLGAVLFVV